MSERYNGWTNYETWNVKLWIDNEEATYDYWQVNAEVVWLAATADVTFSRKERAAFTLADDLKSKFENDMPELHGPYADLLNAALLEVNWLEIAHSILEGVPEAAAAE
jgi:hypothetical protein